MEASHMLLFKEWALETLVNPAVTLAWQEPYLSVSSPLFRRWVASPQAYFLRLHYIQTLRITVLFLLSYPSIGSP